MKNTEKSHKSKKSDNIGKHLLIVFVILIIGYTIGYFIGTENSILYGVVIAGLLAEFGFVIHHEITK